MQDFAPAPVLIEEGENLQGCGKRVALARSQKQDIAGKGREDLPEEPFGASGPDEDDIQVALAVLGEIVATEIEPVTEYSLDG